MMGSVRSSINLKSKMLGWFLFVFNPVCEGLVVYFLKQQKKKNEENEIGFLFMKKDGDNCARIYRDFLELRWSSRLSSLERFLSLLLLLLCLCLSLLLL